MIPESNRAQPVSGIEAGSDQCSDIALTPCSMTRASWWVWFQTTRKRRYGASPTGQGERHSIRIQFKTEWPAIRWLVAIALVMKSFERWTAS